MRFRKTVTLQRTAKMRFVPSWKTTLVDGATPGIFSAPEIPNYPYLPAERKLFGKVVDVQNGAESKVTSLTLTNGSARAFGVEHTPVTALTAGTGYATGAFEDVLVPSPIVSPFVSRMYCKLVDEQAGQETYVDQVQLLDVAARYPRISTATTLSFAAQTSGTANNFMRCRYGNGLFIAFGENGTIVTSPTGLTGDWTSRTSGFGAGITVNDMLWDGTRWVAVCSNGAVISSADGVTWATLVTVGGAPNLRGIAFSGTHYLAAANGNLVFVSTTAASWSATANPAISGNFSAIAYGSGRFVAVGDTGQVRSTMNNGSSWATGAGAGTQNLQDVIWTGTQYIATGNTGTVRTSPDASTWTSRDISTSNGIVRLGSSGSYLVATGGVTGTSGVVYQSTDAGVTWTSIHTWSGGGGRGVAFGPMGSIVVGQSGAAFWSSYYLRLATYPTKADRAAGTLEAGHQDAAYPGTPTVVTIAGKLSVRLRDLTPALLASARDFDVTRCLVGYTSSADRTANTSRYVVASWSPEGTTPPVATVSLVTTAGSVTIGTVHMLTATPAAMEFIIELQVLASAFATDAAREAETPVLGSVLQPYFGLPAAVTIPSQAAFTLASVTTVDLPLSFNADRSLLLYLTAADRTAGTGPNLAATWSPAEDPAPYVADILDEVDEAVGTVEFLSTALPPFDFELRAHGLEEGDVGGEVTIRASVQPVGAKEAESVAKMTDGRQAYWLYTDVNADIRDAQSGTADRITLAGSDYELMKIELHDSGVLPHKRALCVSLTPLGGRRD
jgi:hypothetical protein